MGAGDVAAVLVAAVCLVAVAVLVVAVSSLVRTLRSLRETVDVLREQTVPLVADLRAAVDHATTGLDRVDELLDTAESISTTVDAASRLTYRAFSPPLIGAAAVSAGIGRFVRRLRGGSLATGPGDAVVEAGAVELRRGRRRGGAA